MEEDDKTIPKFDFTGWNPEPPAGLSYLSLLPIGRGYEIAVERQDDHVGKVRVSAQHRKARQQKFASGSVTGKNILGLCQLMVVMI